MRRRSRCGRTQTASCDPVPLLDFDAARREAVKEPVAFQLRGERFDCLAKCPAGALFDLSLTGYTGKACKEFLESVISEADHDRFGAVLRNRNDPVDLDDLGDAARAVVEAYVNRPTQPSTDSSDGRPSTGRSSKARSKKKGS